MPHDEHTSWRLRRLRVLPFHQRLAARQAILSGDGAFSTMKYGAPLVTTRTYEKEEEPNAYTGVIVPEPVREAEEAFKSLGLTTGASKAEIKSAVRRLSMEHHPDRGGDIDKFREVIEARDVCLKWIG